MLCLHDYFSFLSILCHGYVSYEKVRRKEEGLERNLGLKVSSIPQCASPGSATCLKTLPSATLVSHSQVLDSTFRSSSMEEDQDVNLFSQALPLKTQGEICQAWKEGKLWCMGGKYKPVGKKVRPVNEPMPQQVNPPLSRPTLSRDPYQTPLTQHPPKFQPTSKVTEERLQMVNFGPKGWLSEQEMDLFRHLIVLREKAVAFCPEERGLLKHSYGLPYVVPVVEHQPWQKRPIPIPKAIQKDYIELVREWIKTGLYQQSSSSYSSPVFCVLKHDGRLRVVHDLQCMNKVTIKDAGIPPAPEEFVEAFSGRVCYGLADIMGGYDERELDPTSRPMTTFETPLGRFQLTRPGY